MANDRKAGVSAGADVNEPQVWKLAAHDGEVRMGSMAGMFHLGEWLHQNESGCKAVLINNNPQSRALTFC